MKKIICFVMAIAMIFSLTACTKYSIDYEKYDSFAQNNIAMPVADDLGDYSCLHTLCYPDMGLDNYTLIACYDEESYQAEKSKVQEKYIYEADALYDHIESHQLDPQFTLGEYEFCLLDVEEYLCSSPESYFIGFNDEKHKIAYVYYADNSLDVVNSYEELLIDNCGWSIAVLFSEELSREGKA